MDQQPARIIDPWIIHDASLMADVCFWSKLVNFPYAIRAGVVVPLSVWAITHCWDAQRLLPFWPSLARSWPLAGDATGAPIDDDDEAAAAAAADASAAPAEETPIHDASDSSR